MIRDNGDSTWCKQAGFQGSKTKSRFHPMHHMTMMTRGSMMVLDSNAFVEIILDHNFRKDQSESLINNLPMPLALMTVRSFHDGKKDLGR